MPLGRDSPLVGTPAGILFARRARFAKAEDSGRDSRGWGCEKGFSHQPVARSKGLAAHELMRVAVLVVENQERFLAAWREFFDS